MHQNHKCPFIFLLHVMKVWPPAAILMRLLVKVQLYENTSVMIAGIHDLRRLAQIFQLQTQISNEECLSKALSYALWALDSFLTLTNSINSMVSSDRVENQIMGFRILVQMGTFDKLKYVIVLVLQRDWTFHVAATKLDLHSE